MESRGTPRAQLGDGAYDPPAAVEEYGIDGKLHEEGVDRVARSNQERIAFREGGTSQKPAHALADGDRTFHAVCQNDVTSRIDEAHFRCAGAAQACTKATRGPARTISRPGAVSISPSRKYPNGRGARSSTSSATASSSRSRRAGRPKSSLGTSRAKLRGRAVRPSTWNDPGCSVARRNGRKPSPASATLEPTTP